MKNNIIKVQNIKVNITNINDNDYICILGSIYNPNFNSVEFDGVRKNADLHTFTLN